MNYFLHNAINVRNVIDHTPKPVTQEQYLSVSGGDNLILESVTLEEVEATYFYGLPAAPVEQSKFYDAIKTTKNRIDTTMGAFGRALNSQLNGTGIEAAQAEIGSPRKAGQFAIMSALFPLSDGQGITIVFHSPTNDPAKITEQDDLIAFRFLLNKRDVTHVVAPSGGQDISLKQTTLVLANLAERNSAKFQAKQSENKQKQDELKTIQDATSQLQTEADTLTTQADDLTKQQQDAADAVARTKTLVDNQKARNAALQDQLDGLKTPAPVKPVPTIAGEGDKPVVPAELVRTLATRQNRPKVGTVFFGGLSKVSNATDRVVDVVDSGDDGKKLTRWTWDGIGYKNKGAYLLTNGSYCYQRDIDSGEVSAGSSIAAPTNGIREIKQRLSIDGKFTLDNGSEIKMRSKNNGGNLVGSVSITEPDGTTFTMSSPSSQGGAMQDTASSLYKLYKDGRAGEYRVHSDVSAPVAEQEPSPQVDEPVKSLKLTEEAAVGYLNVMQFGSRELRDFVDGKASASDTTIQLKAIYDLYAHMDAAVRDYSDFSFGKSDREKLLGHYLGVDEMTARDISNTKTKGILPDGKTAVFKVPEGGSLFDAEKLLRGEYSQQDILKVLADLGGYTSKVQPTDEQQPPAPTLYWYGLRARPVSLGTVPVGQVETIDSESVKSDPRTAPLVSGMPSENAWRWGAVAYDRQLTDKEVSDFELVPLSGTKWTPEYRAEKFAEFKDWMSSSLDGGSLTEFINNAIKPNGSMVNDSPFSSLGIYYPQQLTKALQEAGYFGGIFNMINALYDELTTTDEDRAYQAEQERIQQFKDKNQQLIDGLKNLIKGIRKPNGWAVSLAPEDDWFDIDNSESIPKEAKYKQPMVDVTLPEIEGDDSDLNRYMVIARYNQETGEPTGTFRVTYSEGSPLDGGDNVTAWKEAEALIAGVYDAETAKLKRPAPQPEPTPPVAETGNAAVTKALADLQDLFDNETNIDAYLMKMEAAFNEIDAAGATAENEPFMQKVADKLTALMAAEGVAA